MNRKPAPASDPDDRPLTEAELAALTQEFRVARQMAHAGMVEGSVRLGSIIERGRRGVPHRRFRLWIEGDLRMKMRTAQRMAAIARLSVRHAKRFDRLKKLGTSIVGEVATLPEEALSRVLERGAVRVPGSGRPVPLDRVGVVELRTALRPLRKQPGSFNPRAQATAVAARARNVEARLKSLEGHWGRVPAMTVREVEAALSALCRLAARAPWK